MRRLPPGSLRLPIQPKPGVAMIEIVLLWGPRNHAIERWEEAPELVTYNDVLFSRRAGPRTPYPTDHAWDPIAVYAPDELTEEEFQDLFYALQPDVPELALKFDD